MRTQLRLAVPLAAIVVAAIVVAGCVSIAAPPKEQVIGQQQVRSKSYTLGVAAEAFVGNDVIRVKDYSLTRRDRRSGGAGRLHLRRAAVRAFVQSRRALSLRRHGHP